MSEAICGDRLNEKTRSRFAHPGYTCCFFSNEGQPPEPPHIHIKGGGWDASF